MKEKVKHIEAMKWNNIEAENINVVAEKWKNNTRKIIRKWNVKNIEQYENEKWQAENKRWNNQYVWKWKENSQ